MPAVRPGTTTGSEKFFPLREGFFFTNVSFHIARKSGLPAVGAYAISSPEESSGASFCMHCRLSVYDSHADSSVCNITKLFSFTALSNNSLWKVKSLSKIRKETARGCAV